MQFRAVCFDLDGTLLDSLADLAFCTNEILWKRGFPKHDLEKFRYFIGDGARNLITRALPERIQDKKIIEECLVDFEKTYRENWDKNTLPYKGIPELLDALQRLGFKLTILSNKPHEFTLLTVENLLHNWDFDVVLGQNKKYKKPDPAGFFEISKKLKIPSEEFIFLGDTGTDMKTAVAAGCFPVGALWGFRHEKELINNGARALVKKPIEILDLLDV